MDRTEKIYCIIEGLRFGIQGLHKIFDICEEYMELSDYIIENSPDFVRQSNRKLEYRKWIESLTFEFFEFQDDEVVDKLYSMYKERNHRHRARRQKDSGLTEFVNREIAGQTLALYYYGELKLNEAGRMTLLQRFKDKVNSFLDFHRIPLYESERYAVKLIAFQFLKEEYSDQKEYNYLIETFNKYGKRMRRMQRRTPLPNV